ncbi:MAG: ACP S-malonyltransferase [Chitinivibrionales bacterium]|nr:ACP S-malonyltransferase [Chitinivibrionales bacterium]MBD3395329.1 ACP S-malonyltransferase [Chitinivibrionales bacterium]
MEMTFLFPGQGSQKVGMGADFFEKFEMARRRFDEANDILGRDLKKICFEGPPEELTQTRNTQPALFVTEAAICDVLQENGITPALALGHSLGEYGALYAAGVYSFADGVRIVAKRGELMGEAGTVAPGAMAAVIGLARETIAEVLSSIESGTVVPANENAPEQTVISGDVEAVKAACGKLQAAGAKRVVDLPVSGAFHSPLMQQAADQFATFIASYEFREARCEIIPNVTAQRTKDSGQIRDLLVKQLVSLVRWVDAMALIAGEGAVNCVEVGPGSVLKGLARKCDPGISVAACATVDNLYSLTNS